MANLAPVLSEPIYGADYVDSDLGLWSDDAGHAFVMGELTHEQSVQRVLEVALA